MKPEHISYEAWDKARSFLSVNFTVPIGDRLYEVIALAINIQALEAYDFKMVTWDEFENISDLPAGLIDRATQYRSLGDCDFVVYDPIDNADGLLIVGSDPHIVSKDACNYISDSEPDEGPLSEDNIAMGTIEGYTI